MYDDNTFFQLEHDEFGGIDDIATIYPRNPFDDDGADNIFGLGNKQKKAEKKIRKAEKQLAKGHVAKAEKKIAKAAKKLGEQPLLKQSILQQGQTILAGKPITDATNTQQTESLSTTAGQIGAQAGAPTMQPSYGGGGGGGDIGGGSMDTGYTPEQSLSNIADPTTETTPSDEPTGDLATVKDLQGVTVTAHKGNKTLMFIIIGVVVLLAIWYFSKHKSLKLK